MNNPIGFLKTGLITGATLVITNWQKIKDFLSSFREYIKSIIKPIREIFSWIGSSVGNIFKKNSKNRPVKEFAKRESCFISY